MGTWLAESLTYMAEYIGDAREQCLPLVGGHLHDWNWLLTRVGLLDQCTLIAGLLHGFASAPAFGMLIVAARAVLPAGVGRKPRAAPVS